MLLRKITLFAFFLLQTNSLFKQSAHATLLEDIAFGGRPVSFYQGFKKQSVDRNSRYQVGDVWGKQPINVKNLGEFSDEFQRAAFASLRVGGATGFYLGKFDGAHIVATNHHVFPHKRKCLGRKVKFDLLNRSFSCTKFIGHWPSVDLALFVINVKTLEDEQLIEPYARNFNFTSDLYPGQMLMTLGFGIANNRQRNLVGTIDDDCKVFSQSGDLRLMADPDKLNPGSYKAWSFALGCDVSHGDSGSAIVDRDTGDVVGIIWTGKIPKSPAAQSSANLDQWLAGNSTQIWTELNYAAPSSKIYEVLQGTVDRLAADEDSIRILRSLLAG